MSAVPANTRLIRFAGNTIRFVTHEAGILRALDAHLKNCQGGAGAVVATYEIAAVDDAFSVTVNGGNLYSGVGRGQVLPLLMRDGLAQLNGTATASLVFHAAALTRFGRGLILSGPGGSGKSSLAAWLTATGFQYLTDEVVSFPLEGAKIDGFCRSIVLKRGSEFIWRHWLENKSADDGFLRFEDGSAWVAPTLFNPNAICQSAVPRVVVFPKYVSEAPMIARRLTPADSLFRLMQCLVNARNFPDGGMSAAARFAKQAQSYSLIYSDMEGAAEWITQTLRAA